MRALHATLADVRGGVGRGSPVAPGGNLAGKLSFGGGAGIFETDGPGKTGVSDLRAGTNSRTLGSNTLRNTFRCRQMPRRDGGTARQTQALRLEEFLSAAVVPLQHPDQISVFI